MDLHIHVLEIKGRRSDMLHTTAAVNYFHDNMESSEWLITTTSGPRQHEWPWGSHRKGGKKPEGISKNKKYIKSIICKIYYKRDTIDFCYSYFKLAIIDTCQVFYIYIKFQVLSKIKLMYIFFLHFTFYSCLMADKISV